MTNCFAFAACAAVAILLILPSVPSEGTPSPNFFKVAAAYNFR